MVEKFDPLLKVNISVQRAFFDDEIAMFDFAKNAIMNHREGFFKLESSMNLTASEVYEIYRRKDSVEKLIESLKNHINIKPLRVWSEPFRQRRPAVRILGAINLIDDVFREPFDTREIVKIHHPFAGEFDSNAYFRCYRTIKANILQFRTS